jgi:anaerobic selenocysteine-containing dehydrogenase
MIRSLQPSSVARYFEKDSKSYSCLDGSSVNTMSRETFYSACPLNCPDICAFRVTVEDGRIVRLEGDENHPYTLGRACPKGYAHVLRTYSEDRLRYPMRRNKDGTYRRISWDDALDEIAERIETTLSTHGPNSIGIYSGSGNDGMAPRYAARFANVIGTRMIPGIVEICFQGAYEGARFNVGPFPPHELQDWANSRCIVIWGTNKHESGVHCKRAIDEAIENGAKLIVIDPRKTPYAKKADIYTTIRPGTDAALALGVANEIIRRGLYNSDFVRDHITGFGKYRERVEQYDRKTVSRLTWVRENTIEQIAIAFATHGPSLIMTAPAGMNHYTNGSWAARAVHSLLAICGYLGVSGGGFQYLSSDFSPFNSAPIRLDHLLDHDVKPVVPSGTYLPEHILSGSEPAIEILTIQAASPVTQWPNTNKTKSALEKVPFKICIDLEMTDTARLCDIVLPATLIFEHDNLVHSELHRIVQYAPRIIEPIGESRNELSIWTGIAQRLGLGGFFELVERDAIRLALDSEDCRDITLEDLESHPEGIRTRSPRIPFSDKKFKTASGKVELYSAELESLGHDPLPIHEEPVESPHSTPEILEDYPLIMISGRLRCRLHSQYTTVEVGAKVTDFARCTTCQKCVKECPEEAIQMTAPTAEMLQRTDGSESSAKMRAKLGTLITGLSTTTEKRPLSIPKSITGLLVPGWDTSRCIGCRECQLDICPYDVVGDPVCMRLMSEVEERRAFLRMHPDTARQLDLRNGDRVVVESVRGRVDGIRLEIDQDIDPRIVWSSDGWWNQDGNINMLTDDKHTAFGHTPGFNSVLVRVDKSEAQ